MKVREKIHVCVESKALTGQSAGKADREGLSDASALGAAHPAAAHLVLLALGADRIHIGPQLTRASSVAERRETDLVLIHIAELISEGIASARQGVAVTAVALAGRVTRLGAPALVVWIAHEALIIAADGVVHDASLRGIALLTGVTQT